jgi:cyclin C
VLRLIYCPRFILNDTYRSELCLLYPPHIIAIAALYLTLILHRPTRDVVLIQLPSGDVERSPARPPEQTTPTPQPRRSSRQAHNTSTVEKTKKPQQDPIDFLAGLNVSLPLIATVSQQIISLYTLWDRYKDDDAPKHSRESGRSPLTRSASGSTSPAKRSAAGSRSASVNAGSSNAGTPMDAIEDPMEPRWSEGSYVTPAMLSALLQRMREARVADISHPSTGRPVAINKMLERTQAAG